MRIDPTPDIKHIFLSLRLANPAHDLLIRHKADLRRAMRKTIRSAPVYIDTITVLPAVLHMIWRTPSARASIANIVDRLKSDFAAPLLTGVEPQPIWMPHDQLLPVTCPIALMRYRQMIHHAAVDAGLCKDPQDWPHCSIHRDRAPTRQARSDHAGRITTPLEPVI